MHKIGVCAIAAAMVAIGLGVWTASTSTPVVTVSRGIDPFQMMTNARGLPFTEFVDYTFVFVDL